MENINIELFFDLSKTITTIDVRSESEYKRGHLPHAINIPLFNDSEHREIGTIYKKIGKDQAMMKGLEIVGPKLKYFVKETQKIAPDKNILVNCWRGGMRSNSFSMLLKFCGFNVKVLQGGYKAYRKFVLDEFSKEREIIILGGKTGSGKTDILKKIKKTEQFIDLEKLAFHKGSAFGGYDTPEDLTVEHFENMLHYELLKTEKNKPLWLEDESRTIGKIPLPNSFWEKMRNATVIFIEIPKNIRIKNIIKDYSNYPKEKLIESIKKIERKLGGFETKNAIEALIENNYQKTIDILLFYYDKTYMNSLSKRDPSKILELSIDENNYEKIEKILIEFKNKNRIQLLNHN